MSRMKYNQTRLVNTYDGQLRIDIPELLSRQVAADPERSACIRPGRGNDRSAYLDSLTTEQLVALTSDDTCTGTLIWLGSQHGQKSTAISGEAILPDALEAICRCGV